MYRGKFVLKKSIGLACGGREIYLLLCIRGQIRSTSPREAYIRTGNLTVFFCVTIWRSLYMEGLIFGILRYFMHRLKS